jgi:hypothetical protein
MLAPPEPLPAVLLLPPLGPFPACAAPALGLPALLLEPPLPAAPPCGSSPTKLLLPQLTAKAVVTSPATQAKFWFMLRR